MVSDALSAAALAVWMSVYQRNEDNMKQRNGGRMGEGEGEGEGMLRTYLTQKDSVKGAVDGTTHGKLDILKE